MTPDDAALAHLSNEPVVVELSTGDAIKIYPVSLSVLSHIAVSVEQGKIAHVRYHALMSASQNPEVRIWERERRLQFLSHEWVKKTERICMEIACLSARPHIRGWGRAIRIFVHDRRIRRSIRRATWVDVHEIIRTYRELNEIDAIVATLFGKPPPDNDDGAKKKAKSMDGRAS